MHDFVPSQLDQAKCITCKRRKVDHSIFAECEACGKLGPCELHADLLLCKAKCYPAELAAIAAINKPEEQQKRVDAHNAAMLDNKAKQLSVKDLIAHSEKIDQSIELVDDIYNAETKALIELIKAIDADESIQNKPLARAQLAINRIKTFQQSIFEKEQAIIREKSGLRASKTYLNQIISSLREEEREQFRLKDIDYPARAPKTPKTKSKGTKKAKQSTKIDFTEINIWAAKVGLDRNAIHSIMAARGMTAEQAARHMAKLLEINID